MRNDAAKNDGVGYYFYYYYWNRHNDNELSATMGPMEFAVVRNNVYKLAVTGIAKLGHPRISGTTPTRWALKNRMKRAMYISRFR